MTFDAREFDLRMARKPGPHATKVTGPSGPMGMFRFTCSCGIHSGHPDKARMERARKAHRRLVRAEGTS